MTTEESDGKEPAVLGYARAVGAAQHGFWYIRTGIKVARDMILETIPEEHARRMVEKYLQEWESECLRSEQRITELTKGDL